MPVHRQTLTGFGFLSSVATFSATSTKSKTHNVCERALSQERSGFVHRAVASARRARTPLRSRVPRRPKQPYQ